MKYLIYCSLNYYNTPFLAPIAPLVNDDLKDSFIKVPLPKMKKRPKSISQKNTTRLGDDNG